MRLTFKAAPAALFFVATAAHAAPETHDGFALQMSFGPAAQAWQLNFDTSAGAQEYEVTGGGVMMDFAIGGALTENLILFGQLGVVSSVGPELSIKSESSSSVHSDDDVAASTAVLGVGLMYYFSQINMFFGASLVRPSLELTFDNTSVRSESGGGLHLRLGKEWWVGDEWGLGLALHAMGGRIPAQDEAKGEDWEISTFALTLSATYN